MYSTDCSPTSCLPSSVRSTTATHWKAQARIRQTSLARRISLLGRCGSRCLCSLMPTATKCLTQFQSCHSSVGSRLLSALVAGWSTVNPIRRQRIGWHLQGCPLPLGGGQKAGKPGGRRRRAGYDWRRSSVRQRGGKQSGSCQSSCEQCLAGPSWSSALDARGRIELHSCHLFSHPQPLTPTHTHSLALLSRSGVLQK